MRKQFEREAERAQDHFQEQALGVRLCGSPRAQGKDRVAELDVQILGDLWALVWKAQLSAGS